jgi:hypothetical protein
MLSRFGVCCCGAEALLLNHNSACVVMKVLCICAASLGKSAPVSQGTSLQLSHRQHRSCLLQGYAQRWR